MKVRIIYPKWPKLRHQPEFKLPPHGPVVFAAALSDEIEISFCDEHVQELDFQEDADLIALSVTLTCQMPRAWEIADRYREEGKPVVFGGIATMLHAAETMEHADAVFVGEAEGHFDRVIEDFKKGQLKPVYDHLNDHPDMRLVKTARRDILDRELYSFRGVQMVDLVHASRGCHFNCFPCCTPYLGGRVFRPRPLDQVVREIESIDNNRLFIVDNSLAQDDDWLKALFTELAPLKKKWVSHPIKDDDQILDLAAEAGCWYMYQAIVDDSDHIRRRVKRVKERGIGVEGTILLGLDEHDGRFRSGDRSRPRRVHRPDAIPAHTRERRARKGRPNTPQRLGPVYGRSGGLPTPENECGLAPGDVRVRLGSLLRPMFQRDPDGEAVPQSAGDGEEGRHVQESKAESGSLLGMRIAGSDPRSAVKIRVTGPIGRES